jgi:hypothetical protein
MELFFLYSGQAVNPCILVALYEISTEQAKPTTDTRDKTDMLMDYLHTYPNAVIRFHASNMILKICSDAAYLVLPKAKSRLAVHFHLGWQNNPTRVNGAVAVLCQTLKNVVGSATEAEISGVYTGGRHSALMIATLKEMRHKQPSTGTPFETDNSCAHGILNSKMRQKLSKAFDMHFWWIKDQTSKSNTTSSGPPVKPIEPTISPNIFHRGTTRKIATNTSSASTAPSALLWLYALSYPHSSTGGVSMGGCVSSPVTQAPHRNQIHADITTVPLLD